MKYTYKACRKDERHVTPSQPSLKSVSSINFLIRQGEEVSGIVLCQNCEVILHLLRRFSSFICQPHRFFILSPLPKNLLVSRTEK